MCRFLNDLISLLQAKLLEEMDEEFGISALVDEEFSDTIKPKVFICIWFMCMSVSIKDCLGTLHL